MTTRSGLSLRPTTPVCPNTSETNRTVLTVSQYITDVRQTTTHRIEIPLQQIQQDGQWSCSHCGEDLATEEEAIGCDSKACNRWFHPSCLTDKTYLNDCKWYCHLCPEISVVEAVDTQNAPAATTSVDLDGTTEDITPLPDVIWGNMTSISEIKHNIDQVYNEIVTWKKNIFKLPRGRVGKEFVTELTRLINLFNFDTPWW